MPQTAFVTKKALALGLKPIVVINKVDRPGARPDWVVDQTFDLFDRLGADDDQLDFPVVYASALEGWASRDVDDRPADMTALFQAIVDHVSPPSVDPDAPLQLQVSALDYSSYTGVIGLGRVRRGEIRRGQPVTVVAADGSTRKGKVQQVFGFRGLDKVERESASAGDIVTFSGLEPLNISDTLCAPEHVEAMPALTVDEPTVSMTFQVNDSPFAGRDGQYVTSRQIKERLERELLSNVALRVEQLDDADKFKVSGRGELHLSILIETMRREGYEIAVGRPQVVLKEIDGTVCEPFETLTVDVEEDHQGAVMERLGARKAEMTDMVPDGAGRVRVDYMIPTRGLIGFRSEFLTLTQGSGLLFHTFDHYAPRATGEIGQRRKGAIISMETGKALAFALWNIQERGQLFIEPGAEVYEGMIIGVNARAEDMIVNPLKGKKLTNIRAAGSDENVILPPPIRLTLEYALEFINDDELVEVTPAAIRIRKKLLLEHERKKAQRTAAAG
jgi:GTP-binding protein